ncbi:MAG: TraR/DksA C4-type zinc finger protein [Alphaproteobacteria bacterium]|nr:TraR/DksA C4-type zinc finger protein [Alphaproteobacteria bacterium]
MDIAIYRERIKGELDALAQASADARDARAPVELDQQSVGRLSRMDAMQVQAMAKETERRRKARMEVLRGAIKRMDAGEFGFCTACGEEIAEKRLDLDAAVATCIDCAAGGRRGR